MNKLELHSDPRVKGVFQNYPPEVRSKMDELRALVIDTASECDDIDQLEETLKWGEPSYITKNGSTLRMDWKEKSPDKYHMYFKCTSRLVETFRTVYPNELEYEGNRAIAFDLKRELPREALTECIKATLRYHKVKSLAKLGM